MPDDNTAPVLSLIICSRNRADRLPLCLEAVAKLTCRQSWELILVDNGSTDDTAAVMQAFLARFGQPGRVVAEARPGNSHGRNAGIAASRGEIIVFTDDDCYPAPDYLEAMAAVFQAPRLGFVSGRILLHDPTDFPITYNESMVPLSFPARRFVPCGIIQGANMAFRKAALTAAGGFDPLFGAGARFAGEEWEIAARIGQLGWDGAYAPAPTVSHHHRRKAADAVHLITFYNTGSGAVYAKLLRDPATRWVYAKGWLRRMLGDAKAKQNRRKIREQWRGAITYWQLMSKRQDGAS